jgi:two-component system LytT family response regulator
MRMVPVEQILMLVAQGNYVELVLPGRSVLLRDTLASLVERLDPARFVRIHRSRAVRIDLVDQVESCGAGQYALRLRDGTCLGSGRSYRHALRTALGLPRGTDQPAAAAARNSRSRSTPR